MEVFSGEQAAEYIDARRIAAIQDALRRRIGNLSRIVQSFSGQERLSTKDDVAENMAEEYGSK
ncbi:MAG: hypothetical protein LUE23_07735 [Lachnospiraceae bacterium]|nr:hypothetical protein [Lachnospiraceae bacterium]